jgi:hypothetical protein
MATRRIEHTFECDVDTFWNEFFLSEEFNKQLFLGRLGFSRWEVVKSEPTDDGIRRVVEAVPSTKDLPGPLRKALQNGLGYREEGVWSRSQSLYTLRVIPVSLPDKIEVTGAMRVVAEGKGCRRTYDAEAHARIMLVGGLLETRLLNDVSESYEVAAAFSREWLERRG